MSQLEVPLQAHRRPIDGREHIIIWQNGKELEILAPVRPYFITKKRLRLDTDDCQESQLTVKPITSLEEIPAYKYSFPEVQYISKFNSIMRHSHEERTLVCENHLGFLERVAIDCPEFFNKYPEQLNSHFVFDIETASENHLQTKRIIAIGISDGTDLWCYDGDEKDILENFIRDWQRIDPDVIVTYNGKYFDLPVVVERCEFYGLSTNWVSRVDGNKGYSQSDEGRIHRIKGRVMFDVWEQVDSDQSLFGIKNRRLKTVAKWFGFPAIEEELFSTVELLKDPERLKSYCMSDVRITEQLYDIYKHKLIQIANTLKFPYDQVVNPPGSKGKKQSKGGRARENESTLFGRLVCARGMLAGGYVEDGQNRLRYPEIYLYGGGQNYQGATVSIERTGLFKDILHIDFSGFYPSIQISINISPETTKLLKMEPYDASKPLVREKGNDYTIFCIPDNRLQQDGRNAIIKVDQSFVGSLPDMLQSLADDRAPLKKEEKSAKRKSQTTDFDDEKEKWKNLAAMFKSQQNGLKVIGNACGYGANAPAEVRYGSVAVAILITGIARYMLELVTKFINSTTDLKLIERDTDGLYYWNEEGVEWDSIVEAINAYIAEEASKWSLNPKMKMDATHWPAGWFYKQKNYVLQGPDGTLKFTGVAFKASSKPKMYDTIRDELAKLRLNDADEEDVRAYLKKVMRIENWAIPALTMRRSISKYPHQYKTNDLGRRLAEMGEDLLGINPEPFNQYEYVFSKESVIGAPPDFPVLRAMGEKININPDRREIASRGYMLAALAQHENLNYKKYRGQIADLCNYFGYKHLAAPLVKDPGITALSSWGVIVNLGYECTICGIWYEHQPDGCTECDNTEFARVPKKDWDFDV